MIKGYGVIELNENIEARIGSWTIHLTLNENSIEYTRRTTQKHPYNVIGEKKTRIVGSEKIILQPLYPVLLPKKITTSILIEYNEKITLAPGEQVEYYLLMPVDLAVLSAKHNYYSLIDVFNVGKVKYTLYGPIETSIPGGAGIVARYASSKIFFTKESALDELDVGLALVRVKAHNKAREWVTLSKILLEANPLKLYYEEHTWRAYSRDIVFNISSPKTATIVYSNPPKPGVREVIDPPELKVPLISLKTTMSWGL